MNETNPSCSHLVTPKMLNHIQCGCRLCLGRGLDRRLFFLAALQVAWAQTMELGLQASVAGTKVNHLWWLRSLPCRAAVIGVRL